MLSLSKPSRQSITTFLAAQESEPFSYPEVECTRKGRPDGYNADHNRVLLGHGLEVYEKARQGIRQWKMFEMGWLELCWPNAPIEAGTTVAVAISHFGFWSVNPSRVVYVENTTPERYGFAYGTLPEHQEIGEERFAVEFDAADESVWYDLYAISRPGALARLGCPFARALQKRFARDSLRAMLNFVLA
jgi:uncharacterized protein (UPF0548 family)